MSNTDEVHALAEAILEAARVAGLGVTVSYDDGVALRTIYANDAVSAIAGYSVDEMLGDLSMTLFVPEDRERMQSVLSRCRRGETANGTTEVYVARNDGARVPVELSFSMVQLGGEPAIVTFLRDIRERKQAEEALRRSEKRLRQLTDAAPDAIGVVREGKFVYVNVALTRLFARPIEELVEHHVDEFVHPDDRDSCDGSSGEFRVLHPDGRVINVELSSIPIDYEDQPAILGFARDTSERKQMHAHLAFADRMATLGMLAAGVAHEINNPLAYVALNVESLARMVQRGAETAVEEVAAARTGLARVATIVRDLRSFSTPVAEERWPVDVEAVLESAVNIAMHLIRGRASLKRGYGAAPPLKTDPARLGQVFLNLLFNAAQSFDEADETRNELTMVIESPDPCQVVVTVADNGPGIPKENLERIFEPFYTTKDSRTGLGLAICQTLVTSLGGRLEVESEVGKGTKFTVRLTTPDLSL
ncbi:Sensory box histidine kinase/response regulator [Labilithrix luteola]|uniref:histidine kinase n=1 Tax=Labilithrix luteola TaxID=1391654 RepID=A0A0K1QA18_9BACT|nr:PAS domain S-box protein [Labilithrix luteola]AKV02240.1 Sensory box histidine kinase/response regulator [Labilithrix luteola]